MPMTGSHLPKSYFRAWHLEAESIEAASREPKVKKARMPRWPSHRRRFRAGQAKSAYRP